MSAITDTREALIPLVNMVAPQGNPIAVMKAIDDYALAIHVEIPHWDIDPTEDKHGTRKRCGDGGYCDEAPGQSKS